MDELLAAKERLQADGVEVVGPNDHTLFKSIYFRDPSGPSGHRLELAVNTGTPERAAKAGRREVGHVERGRRTPREGTQTGCLAARWQPPGEPITVKMKRALPWGLPSPRAVAALDDWEGCVPQPAQVREALHLGAAPRVHP